MGNIKFGNYGKTTLTGSVTAVATSITVADASSFPTIGTGDFFQLVFVRLSDNEFEIVKVTNVVANVITCVRAQESTTGLALIANDAVQVWLTAASFDNVVLRDENGDGFIGNTDWYKASNNAGTGFVNIAQVNASDQIVIGGDVVDLAMVNDTYLKGRNNAGSADINMMKIDTSDNIVFGANITAINLLNNVFFTVRNAADSANIDVFKVDGSDLIQVGNAASQMLFLTGSSEAMRIDASQRLLIGKVTSAATANADDLQVGSTTGNHGISITAATTGISTLNFDDSATARGQILYDHTADFMSFSTAGAEAMRIISDGTVLFDKTVSNGGATAGMEFNGNRLFLTASSSEPLFVQRLTDDGTLVSFSQDGAVEGNISVSGNTVSYNGFCGGHWTQPGKGLSIPSDTPRGSILSTVDEMCEWKEARYVVNGVDTKEDYIGRLPIGGTFDKKVEYEDSDGLIVFETVAATVFDSPKENYVKSKLCAIDEDPRVYGIFATYDKDGDIISHAVGASVIRVQGPIAGGDLIQGSSVPGVGKVQSDSVLKCSTVAKCTKGDPSMGIVTVPCVLMAG